MKKLLSATLAALALSACGPQTDPVEKFRDALPKTQAVTLGTPQAEGATPGALSVARQPLGDSSLAQSEYAVMSYYLALSVNGGAGLILDLVQFITHLPPTECGDASCSWGPWVGDMGLNYYKLDVTKNGDAYVYALSGKSAVDPAATFVEILGGNAYPVDRDHGSGNFTLDFDAQDALAHGPAYEKKDFGRLELEYDNTITKPFVTAQFIGAWDSNPAGAGPHFVNAAYGFEASASGGQLQVAVENLLTTEVIRLRTRWSPGGAGRSDAHYTGAGGTPEYFASECWAGRVQDFAEVYDSKHLEIPALADENACSPFMQADYAGIGLPQ